MKIINGILTIAFWTLMAMAQTPSKQPKTASNWQKMKDCSAQTDRIASRYGWSEWHKTDEIILVRWQNHYSPKYGRCFIQVFYMNSPEKKDPELPTAFSVLHDAFEYREVASCASDFPSWKRSFLCMIGDKIQTCGECCQFIEERMNN
jgi:hypothetical protein